MTNGVADHLPVPERIVSALLAKVDLRALVAESVAVREIDGLACACCPFHGAGNDTWSLVIDGIARRVECRVCAFRASALGWLAYHDGMGRDEALVELARRVGDDLEPWVPAARLVAAGEARQARLAGVTRAWHEALLRRPETLDWLARRGISPDAAARHRLGWAASDTRALDGGDERRQRALWQLGLLIRREDGSFAPRFRDRLMFPVVDADGAVRGFGGRVLDARRPKYLCSPASVAFDRSVLLYGLDRVPAGAAPSTRLILVEGYLDVVSLDDRGVTGAVAALGTAVTDGQLRQAFARASHVTLCLDGDAAGQAAARAVLLRACPVLEDGQRLDVVSLPAGLDPDGYVRERGRKAFEGELQAAVPIDEALHGALTDGLDPGSIGELARLAATARPILAMVRSPALHARLVARLETTLGLPWRAG